MIYETAIIGAGPAGLTAAIYLARAQHKVIALEALMPGGQVLTTERVENYPGFPGGVDGFELMQLFHKQALEMGAEFAIETVRRLESNPGFVRVHTDERFVDAKTVLLATGSRPRLLGVPGEERFIGQGISTCATCDGAFFKNKKVAVVGGGTAALEEGEYLTRFAATVVLIHRRDEFRGTRAEVNRVRLHPKIEIMTPWVVEEVLGQTRLESLRLRQTVTGEERNLPVDGVFLYVGTKACLDLELPGLVTDAQGYVVTDEALMTNVQGVFAAGDVRDTALRQVATAVGDGALVAKKIEQYLEGRFR
jgi:thioredoxin reductase (NADPH)